MARLLLLFTLLNDFAMLPYSLSTHTGTCNVGPFHPTLLVNPAVVKHGERVRYTCDNPMMVLAWSFRFTFKPNATSPRVLTPLCTTTNKEPGSYNQWTDECVDGYTAWGNSFTVHSTKLEERQRQYFCEMEYHGLYGLSKPNMTKVCAQSCKDGPPERIRCLWPPHFSEPIQLTCGGWQEFSVLDQTRYYRLLRHGGNEMVPHNAVRICRALGGDLAVISEKNLTAAADALRKTFFGKFHRMRMEINE